MSRGHALGIYFDVPHKFVAHEREDGVSTRQALRAHSSTARAGRGAIECAIKETLSAATSLKNFRIIIIWGGSVGPGGAQGPKRCMACAVAVLIR